MTKACERNPYNVIELQQVRVKVVLGHTLHVYRGSFLGVKRSGREAGHLHTFNANVKNVWR
jgi:hypothetical protein